MKKQKCPVGWLTAILCGAKDYPRLELVESCSNRSVDINKEKVWKREDIIG
ncbi:MAG TPA: hypothetical protein VED16_03660 [Candidatus Acidoferrum sp.]|nr:hypothetical protein [Candidatus Acidoferrum sp.]